MVIMWYEFLRQATGKIVNTINILLIMDARWPTVFKIYIKHYVMY